MQTLRITIGNFEVGDDEKKFNEKLTDRFLSAGFDLSQPIIKQPRSDVQAMDFIQFKYNFWDKVAVWIKWSKWKIWQEIKRQFSKQEDEKRDTDTK